MVHCSDYRRRMRRYLPPIFRPMRPLYIFDLDGTLALIDHRYEPGMLMMRPENDYRPDEVLKQEFLDSMLLVDRERLVAVFDDRAKVCAMWRRNAVTCLQVAPGDF